MLERIEAQQFRCFERLVLPLEGKSAGLVGPNGSGKTSVLEALYFLVYGKSFRASDKRQLVRSGAQAFSVKAFVDDALGVTTLAAYWSAGELRLEMSGRGVVTGEMASRLSVHLIDPSIHRLVEGAPQERRRLLDTGVFHVEPSYLALWRRFRRALKQRNAALRLSSAPRDAPAWNDEFIESALALERMRSDYLTRWSQAFSHCAAALDLLGAALHYRSGWPAGVTPQEALHQAFARDVSLANTTVGPHRADVAISLDGLAARRRVSRGEQKLLASALVLSQLNLEDRGGLQPVLLVDDPGAELDVDNLGKFLQAIARIRTQVIASTTFPAALEALPNLSMFHVKPDGLARML